MTASFCGTNTAVHDINTTATFSHTLAAGDDRLVVVFMLWQCSVDCDSTGVTYGGVSMTQVGTQVQSGATSSTRAAMWVLEEASLPSDGAQTVDPAWSAAGTLNDIGCYVFCLQDCPSPVFTASGNAGTSLAYYPTSVTAAGLDANSLMFTASVTNDNLSETLSCDIGTLLTQIVSSGQLASRASYSLDTGSAGDQVATWSTSAESTGMKAATVILGVEYTPAAPPASGGGSGWGIIA